MGDFSIELCGGTTPAVILVILVCSIILNRVPLQVRRIEVAPEKALSPPFMQTAIAWRSRASAEKDIIIWLIKCPH